MEENLPLYTIAVNNYEYLQGVYVSYERALENACQMAWDDAYFDCDEDEFEKEWMEYVEKNNIPKWSKSILYSTLLEYIDSEGYYRVVAIRPNEIKGEDD